MPHAARTLGRVAAERDLCPVLWGQCVSLELWGPAGCPYVGGVGLAEHFQWRDGASVCPPMLALFWLS